MIIFYTHRTPNLSPLLLHIQITKAIQRNNLKYKESNFVSLNVLLNACLLNNTCRFYVVTNPFQ